MPSKHSIMAMIVAGIALILGIALHGIDNTSSLNLVFPVVLDGIQYFFGSSRKDESIFEYADDGLPLCNKCHCTPSWNQPLDEFECPSEPPPPWQYPAFTIKTLLEQTVQNPYTLDCNPYKNATCDTLPALAIPTNDEVCGLVYEKPTLDALEQYKADGTCPLTTYKMQTFTSPKHAQDENAVITHIGTCGACSTTQDLAAYMEHPDMVHAGRRCTNRVLLFGHASGVKCYQALGFSQACAEIWSHNSLNTATICRKLCVRHLFSPPNQPPPSCKLNECLHCDEVKSGPLFQKFAGRTRRNSGLRTPILRQCEGLATMTHDACPVGIVLGIIDRSNSE